MSINCRIGAKNGSEFILKALDKCAYEQCEAIGFSRPGKARQLITRRTNRSMNASERKALYAVSEQQKTRKANSHAGFRVLNQTASDRLGRLLANEWWVLRGSNSRPTPCKGAALPTELSTRSHYRNDVDPGLLPLADRSSKKS
jgi:hypothetical protein